MKNPLLRSQSILVYAIAVVCLLLFIIYLGLYDVILHSIF